MLIRAAAFWFLLLATAIANALLRERVLKPWLEASIGKWAHQLSVFTALILMLGMSVLFLKIVGLPYSRADLWRVGTLWCGMTIVFEFAFGRMRGVSWSELFSAYAFWRGELWILLVIGLMFLPVLADKLLK